MREYWQYNRKDRIRIETVWKLTNQPQKNRLYENCEGWEKEYGSEKSYTGYHQEVEGERR